VKDDFEGSHSFGASGAPATGGHGTRPGAPREPLKPAPAITNEAIGNL